MKWLQELEDDRLLAEILEVVAGLVTGTFFFENTNVLFDLCDAPFTFVALERHGWSNFTFTYPSDIIHSPPPAKQEPVAFQLFAYPNGRPVAPGSTTTNHPHVHRPKALRQRAQYDRDLCLDVWRQIVERVRAATTGQDNETREEFSELILTCEEPRHVLRRLFACLETLQRTI